MELSQGNEWSPHGGGEGSGFVGVEPISRLCDIDTLCTITIVE